MASNSGNVTPSLIIGAVVIVIIGVALLPVVNEFCQPNTSLGKENCTCEDINSADCGDMTTIARLICLIPLLYTVVLIVGVVAYIVVASEAI